jgi:hypothetical protein
VYQKPLKEFDWLGDVEIEEAINKLPKENSFNTLDLIQTAKINLKTIQNGGDKPDDAIFVFYVCFPYLGLQWTDFDMEMGFTFIDFTIFQDGGNVQYGRQTSFDGRSIYITYINALNCWIKSKIWFLKMSPIFKMATIIIKLLEYRRFLTLYTTNASMIHQLMRQSEHQMMHQKSRELLNMKCDFSLKNRVLNKIRDSTGCKNLIEGNLHQNTDQILEFSLKIHFEIFQKLWKIW